MTLVSFANTYNEARSARCGPPAQDEMDAAETPRSAYAKGPFAPTAISCTVPFYRSHAYTNGRVGAEMTLDGFPSPQYAGPGHHFQIDSRHRLPFFIRDERISAKARPSLSAAAGQGATARAAGMWNKRPGGRSHI